jgi:ethanolamine ammonia-lyase small subunit
MSFDNYRRYTQARIGLGNAGAALPTKAWLEFSYHHACAVDAIYAPWDINEHALSLRERGYDNEILKTRITTRQEYLVRPDLGRLLDVSSKKALKKVGKPKNDMVILMSNGLSSSAINNHADKFLDVLRRKLKSESLWNEAPILLAENGRVALIDDIGDVLKAKMGIVIIGERPGLSAPDSLALYLTYAPKKGRSDAERNCISNIRPPHGLGYEEASDKLIYLIKESRRRKLSGFRLKEESLADGHPRLA